MRRRRAASSLLCLAGALACGSSDRPRAAARAPVETVRVDSAAWAAMPTLSLDSSATVCSRESGRACPTADPLLGATRADGAVALASRRGALYVLPRDGRPPRQLLFDGNVGNVGLTGGSLEPSGDSAWWFHLPDALARQLVDSTGRVLANEFSTFRAEFAGSAMAGGLFVRLLVPGAPAVGDTVEAAFEVVRPRTRAGERLASMRMRARFREGANIVPLAPFFRPQPIWRVTADERILACDPTAYEMVWLDARGPVRRLVVDAPRRPVLGEELDALEARFMAGIPRSNGMFLRAAQADVARRRRDAGAYHAAVTDLRTTADGRLWVRRSPDVETDSVRWELFSAALAPLGAVMLDGTDQLLAIEPGRLLLARRTERGDTQVGWYALRGSTPLAGAR